MSESREDLQREMDTLRRLHPLVRLDKESSAIAMDVVRQLVSEYQEGRLYVAGMEARAAEILDAAEPEGTRERVFREADVRALYEACMDSSGRSLAPDDFPAPDEWRWKESKP